MSDIPINEPNRYVRQLQDRIREQRTLLEECERALDQAVKFMKLHVTEVSEPVAMMPCRFILDTLRAAQEKADE